MTIPESWDQPAKIFGPPDSSPGKLSLASGAMPEPKEWKTSMGTKKWKVDMKDVRDMLALAAIDRCCQAPSQPARWRTG